MDRRKFLAMGGVAAVAGAARPRTTTASAQHLPDGRRPAGKLLMRRIPSSGETIPAIGLGTSGPVRSGRRRSRARAAARSAAGLFRRRRHAHRHLAHVFHRRSGARRPADARAAGQGLHRHEGVDAGVGRARRTEGRRADAALDGAAQAQAHRAHAGAQPRRSRRASEDAAALEGRRARSSTSASRTTPRALIPTSSPSSSARSSTSCSSTIRWRRARPRSACCRCARTRASRCSSIAPSKTATCSRACRASRCPPGPRSSARRAGRRCSSSSCWRTRP